MPSQRSNPGSSSSNHGLELLRAHKISASPNDTVVENSRCPVRVSVGRDAMFRGNDHFIIQGAIDYVSRLGGGVVELQKGDFYLRRPLDLPSHLSLIGHGESTVLHQRPSVPIPLAADKDWYQNSAILVHTDGLALGDSILLCSQRLDGGEALQYVRQTIVGISGSEVFFDPNLTLANHWVERDARVLPVHSLIESSKSQHIVLRDFVLAGCGEEAPWLDGNVGGAICLNECNDVQISAVTIREFNGDGIAWQASHDVHVKNCSLTGVRSNGIHPGSGSLRPFVEDNTLHQCGVGVYSCWGIQHGLIANNTIGSCTKYGVSVGHRNSQNVIEKNQIKDCREAGIFFRPERKAEYTARQILVIDNSIFCPASPSVSAGIRIPRGSQEISIISNQISRSGNPRATALDVDKDTRGILLKNNIVRD